MTIDNGIGPNWLRALTPDNRSLKYCTTQELTSMGAIERVAIWHGISLGAARDAIGAEMRRRQTTTDYQQGE